MLNLVDLGSNYLPLIHFVPKLRLSSFKEKSSGFDGKEDFKSKFKEDERFEEALSIKNSKTAETQDTHGNATGVHGRAPQAEATKLAAPPHGQPCLHARPCVVARPCRRPPRAVLRFFGLLFECWLDFRGAYPDLSSTF